MKKERKPRCFGRKIPGEKICRIMRLMMLFTVGLVFQLSATGFAQSVRMTGGEQTLKAVFEQVEKQTGKITLFSNNELDMNKTVRLEAKSFTLEDLYSQLLRGMGLTFEITDGYVVIRKVELVVKDSAQQNLVLRGWVRGRDSEPIPGVTISLKSKTSLTMGTVTDIRGWFELIVPVTEGTLEFSFVGYEKETIAFTRATDTIYVVLEEDITELGQVDVISTGFQTFDRRHLTSAVTSLRMDDIMQPGVSTLDQMLEGRVPGMTFIQNSGQVGAAPKLRIRGTATVLGNQEPLWVVDGIIVTDPVDIDPQQINDLDFVNLLGNAISGLNPDDIEQIDILKDAAATAIYGAKAANGVIVVTTKKGKIGKPALSYSFTAGFRQRPHYSDKAVNMMNSRERIEFSRELAQNGMAFNSLSSNLSYEGAYRDYLNQRISFAEFQDLVSYYETVNTDWFDILLKDAFSHSHTVNLSGGTENIRYYASIGYNDEDGNIKKEYNKRYTATINLNLNYNKFSMSFGLSGNTQKREYTPSDVNLMNYAYNTSRAVPLYDEEGELWEYNKVGSDGGSYGFNILTERDNSHQRYNTSALSFNTRIAYQFTSRWRAAVTLSYSSSATDQDTYYGEKTFHSAQLRKSLASDGSVRTESLMPYGGELKKDNQRNETYSARLELTYQQYLDKALNHNISVSLFGDLNSTHYTGLAKTFRCYFPDRGMLISPVDDKYLYYRQWAISDEEALGVLKDQLNNRVAFVATAMYSYKDAYLLNANMRVDYSNKFGDASNDKFLPIWSVSGRWNMKENVLESVGWVNDMALRASFGFQGNMLDTEGPELIIRKGAVDTWFNEMTSEIYKFPNPNLKWEKTRSFNVTLDFALFKNKVQGSVSYYYRKTTDAFLQKTISFINGTNQYSVNKGTLTNSGWEWSFNFIPINQLANSLSAGGERNGFYWRIDPQFGSIINQLVDKLRGKDEVLLDEIEYSMYLNGEIPVAGRPLNTFYSYKFTGLNPNDGRPEFYGIDENEIVEVNGRKMTRKEWYQHEDIENVCMEVMEHSGCRTPFLQGGLSNTFSYKGVILSFNFAYSIGSKIRLLSMYPNVSTTYGTIAPLPESNARREFNNRWRRPGDELHTNIPGVISNEEFKKTLAPWWLSNAKFSENIWQMYDASNVRVASGDYLKLSSISLRYNIPERFCQKIFLKSAYVSLSGSNLFTICSKDLKGQDPTQSGSSSTVNLSVRPMYNVQLNVTF